MVFRYTEIYRACTFIKQTKKGNAFKYLSFQLVHGVIFRKHHNGVLLTCLEPQDTEKVLRDFHDGPVGDTTAHKFMRVGYY